MGHALEDLSSQAFVYEEVVSQFLEKSMNRVQDFSSDGVIRNGTQSILEGQQSAVKNLSDYILKNKIVIDKSIHTISIISPGRPIGVIANFIHISELNSILERIETEEYEGEKRITEAELKRHRIKIYLVNREKRLISKPSSIKDIELNHIIDTLPVRKAIESNEEFSGFYDNYRKISVAGASEYLPEMKWVLIEEFSLTYEIFINLIHPDDREFVKSAVNDALYNKKSYSINYRIVLKGEGNN